MTVKVSDVMRHVRNHFVQSAVTGDWAQQGGVLTPADSLAPGMWIAVTGQLPGCAGTSSAPCGVYQLDENGGVPDLDDATWTGTVYLLSPPADFLRLCGDIACWAEANPDPAVTAEKLGEYTVSRRAVSWQEAFAPALAPYRRMFPEVRV